MEKETELEQAQGRRKERLRQKMEEQIEMVGEIIKDLLDGIRMEELTAKDRFVLIARFMNVQQNGVVVLESFEENREAAHQSFSLSAIIQNLERVEEKEDFRIIDAEIAACMDIDEDGDKDNADNADGDDDNE